MGITTNQITDTLTPSTGTLNIVGTIQQNGTDIALPSQSGNNGRFLTTNGSTSSWGIIGVALDNMSSLGASTSETYITPTYALPTIQAGMAFKFEMWITSSIAAGGGGVTSTFTFRVRVGANGTTGDTQIISDSITGTLSDFCPVRFEGILTFNSSTNIPGAMISRTTSLKAPYSTGDSPVAIIAPSGAGSLTPTYMGLTAQQSYGTVSQYINVWHAAITRIA